MDGDTVCPLAQSSVPTWARAQRRSALEHAPMAVTGAAQQPRETLHLCQICKTTDCGTINDYQYAAHASPALAAAKPAAAGASRIAKPRAAEK